LTVASQAALPMPSTWFGNFKRGVLTATPWTLLAALALGGLALAGLQWFVTSGSFTMFPESHIIRQINDDWGHISYQVGRLKVQPPRHTPVYLLGGSNMRVCIPSERSVALALTRRTGVAVEVHDFGCTEQNFGETMAVIDNLPRTGGVVVISVNQTRFAYAPGVVDTEVSGSRLVMLSPAIARFMASHGWRLKHPQTIATGILTYMASWAQDNKRALSRLQFKPIYFKLHPDYHVYSLPYKQSKVRLYLRTDGRAGGSFDQYFAFNAALLDATVRLAEQRGFKVVLMEAPENREVVGAQFDRVKRVYKPFCRKLAARYGARYVDFNDRVSTVNGDFRDLTHLMPWGGVKWQRGLVDALAPLLRAKGVAASS
jgi:hypothetical protein